MAKIKIGNRNETFSANTADTTYVLEAGKTVTSIEDGIIASGEAQGRKFVIDGKIDALQNGMRLGSDADPVPEMSILIGETGKVLSGARGIEIDGDGHHIENAGRITGVQGINADGDDIVIVNSGTIQTTGAGFSCDGDMSIINTGKIVGVDYGVAINGSAGAVVKNAGTIEADVAVRGAFGDDRFVNSGKIVGDVQFSLGDDVFVFKSGSIDGDVKGGLDDDTYVIGKAGVNIVENVSEGFDFVRASVSFTLNNNIEQLNLVGKKDIDGTGNGGSNHIQGSAGDNVLRGEGGLDFLISGAGNDRLFGGIGGEDIFNFQKGTGKDVVMDFETGVDEIQIGGLKGATTFTDMFDNHTVEKNGDVWITYGSDLVILKDTTKADLNGNDFVFG